MELLPGGGGGGLIQQLGEDVRVLQQFDTLALTDAQITAIQALYKQYPVEIPADQKPLVDKLTEARARLLTGTPLAVGELSALLDEFRKLAPQGRGGPGRGQQQDNPPVVLSPLTLAIWGQLTQTQQAALLGDVRGAAANNQRADRAAAERALKLIARLRGGDDPTWTASRDQLIVLLSAGAGEPDSAARKNSASMFGDYLGRVRLMSDGDFAQKQDELVAGLIALLPPGTNLTAALAEFEPGQLQNAMAASFLSPRAPALLQELLTSRVKPAL
ncbi:MAG: hypothetical protein WCP21_10725 [Armatimonadota bacterium]